MKRILFTILAVATLASCKKKEENKPNTSESAAISNYADIAYAEYKDAYDEALKLQTGINDFCDVPTEAKFENLKVLYANARIPYEKTECFRAAKTPIDEGKDAVEGKLNSWPLEENYIDYVSNDANAGIINSPTEYPVLSKVLIDSLNQKGVAGDVNVTIGYHAIEFLLWGQDLNVDPLSAGQRKYTDYTTLANYERRKTYLKAITEILIADLKYLVEQWQPNGAFRTKFLANSTSDNLNNMFSGIAWFTAGELPTERMFKAVQEGKQEEEHSCFSDLTDQDIKLSMQGISIVMNGSYNKVNGETVTSVGLLKVLEEKDASGAKSVDSLLNVAIANCSKIPAPFDQAIITNSGKVVTDAQKSIFAFSTKLQAVCEKNGIKMNITE